MAMATGRALLLSGTQYAFVSFCIGALQSSVQKVALPLLPPMNGKLIAR